MKSLSGAISSPDSIVGILTAMGFTGLKPVVTPEKT